MGDEKIWEELSFMTISIIIGFCIVCVLFIGLYHVYSNKTLSTRKNSQISHLQKEKKSDINDLMIGNSWNSSFDRKIIAENLEIDVDGTEDEMDGFGLESYRYSQQNKPCDNYKKNPMEDMHAFHERIPTVKIPDLPLSQPTTSTYTETSEPTITFTRGIFETDKTFNRKAENSEIDISIDLEASLSTDGGMTPL